MKTDDFEIGIIGGTGGIGKWFADFFRGEGYPVHASGRNTGMEPPALAERCAVVIVSVPIGATGDAIRRVGPHMRKEALLMDLTSLKTEPVRVMLESSKSEVIGLHPLFGPDVPSVAGQNIIICPGRGEIWPAWIKDILEKRGAALHESTPERHDRMMSYVQGLTHISTILMGAVLREAGMEAKEWEKYSTPVFRARMAMADKVFKTNPGLYAEIVALNPESKKILEQCEEALAEIKKRVGRGGAKGLKEWLEA
jgi:prephenate dehydrogenase